MLKKGVRFHPCIGSSASSIPLANPSQRPHCGRHREQTEADGMEEQSGSFLALQFMLTFLSLLDSLSLLKYLLGGSIANAERAWLSLHVFEGSPAVSKWRENHVGSHLPRG